MSQAEAHYPFLWGVVAGSWVSCARARGSEDCGVLRGVRC